MADDDLLQRGQKKVLVLYRPLESVQDSGKVPFLGGAGAGEGGSGVHKDEDR